MKRTLHLLKLAAILLFAAVGKAEAYDFSAENDDGVILCYNIVNGDAEVTYKKERNGYSGEISIPSSVTNDGTTYRVTSIGDSAFYMCAKLTSVTIPEDVTSIGSQAFWDCRRLTSVPIPEGVTFIGSYAFSYCSSLTSVIIPSSVKYIQNSVFWFCDSLTSINVASSNEYYCSQDGVLFNKDMTTIECCPSGKTGEYTIPSSVTRLGYGAFAGCGNLTSITIPESVTSNGNLALDWAFSDCSSLTSITLPNSITRIGYCTFRNCSSLTSITIPESVTYIGDHAFSDCSSLTTITIPSKVTSIGDQVFASCSSLTSVVIPSSVTSIGKYAFGRCSSLTSITIPDSVTSIGEQAFRSCSSLDSVAIPASVANIGKIAFLGCSSLKSINVASSNANYCSQDGVLFNKDKTEIECCPAGKTGTYTIPSSVKSINYGAFAYGSLTSVAIPNSVTSIGHLAFYLCDSLTSVVIPDSVTSIKDGVFWGCSSLTSVTIPNSVTNIGSLAFYDCGSLTSIFSYITDLFPVDVYDFSFNANATLYVPQGTKEAYDTTAYWNNFANIVEMVPYDVDCDGKLNAWDVKAIIEKLLELFTEVFNQKAADMNGDGEIDVVDAVLMAKQILTGDNGSRSLPAMRHAADAGTASLYSENISATIGQQATLPISLTNTADIAGLQFDLVLPEGVTVATNADGELLGEMATRGAKLSLRGNRLDNGTYRFVAMSMEGANVSGSEGEVVNLTLDVASDVVAGEYDVQVSNVRLAVDGNTQTVVADAHTSTLTVAAPSAITAIETNAETKAYNLRGIQVKSPRRGIVIMNGQKVLRK